MACTDTGDVLLGLIIEKATGRLYYDLVVERFLKPLGLEATEPSNQRSQPGEILHEEFLQPLGMTHVAAAKALGMSTGRTRPR